MTNNKDNYLTAQDILDAAEAIKNHQIKKCEHVISPREYKLGYGICGNCGQMVGNWQFSVIGKR